MSALVKKEIRLLLPMWGMAMLLAVVAPWILSPSLSVDETQLVLFFGGAVILAVASFGREFSLGTFSFLLAQPVDRRQFWWAKFSVLAVAIALMLAAFCLSFQLRANEILAVPDPVWPTKYYFDAVSAFKQHVRKEPYLGCMLGIIAFTGGLWAALLLRQVASSFWVALLVPAFLSLGVSWLVPPDGGWVLVGAWILYSIAGTWWAWRLFQRAEDAAWTGMAATLPVWRFSTARSQSATGARQRSPLATLIGKELQLHHATLFCAVGLLVLHFGVIALRKAGHYAPGGTMQVTLDGFLLIWLAVPIIIGSSAVAEERRLGTLEEHLCLPVSSRVQFTVKFLVTLFLGALLGAVVPRAVEGLAGIFGVASSIIHENSPSVFEWVPALAIAGISFYASTLTSNILQALATSVAMIIGIGLVFAVAFSNVNSSDLINLLPWGTGLGRHFAWTLMVAWIVTAICLAYGNFKHLHRGMRIWFRNILSLATVLVLLATFTTALYHRVWEYLTPLEPAHGPARLTGLKPGSLSVNRNVLTVLMLGGKVWLNRTVGNRIVGREDGGHFINGSNWVDVVAKWSLTVGIQADGSLWVSEEPNKQPILKGGKFLVGAPSKLVRYGDETNWQSVVDFGELSVLLLKRDGTLWRWGGGTNQFGGTNVWPGLRAFIPRRLGTESNWTEIFRTGGRICLRKADGTVWVRDFFNKEAGYERIEFESKLTFDRVTGLESGRWSSTTYARLPSGFVSRVGVRSDGTFRVWADFQPGKQSRNYEWTAMDVQIGNEANWLAVAGFDEKVVTLKRDGSLWLWNFSFDLRRVRDAKADERELSRKIPVQLGAHSDWVAIDSMPYGIFSLAADGSFWWWHLDEVNHYSEQEPQSLLAFSRKPQRIGDVFSASSTAP